MAVIYSFIVLLQYLARNLSYFLLCFGIGYLSICVGKNREVFFTCFNTYIKDEELFRGVHDRYLWWSRSFVDRDDSANAKGSRNFLRSAKPAIQTTSHHGFAIKYVCFKLLLKVTQNINAVILS